MHGSRSRRAGILDSGRGRKTQVGCRLQHQRRREVLRRKSGVEVAEHDLIDVARRDPGVGERRGRDAHDQALDRLAVEFAEWRVCPSDDTRGHGSLPWYAPLQPPLPNFGRFPRPIPGVAQSTQMGMPSALSSFRIRVKWRDFSASIAFIAPSPASRDRASLGR